MSSVPRLFAVIPAAGESRRMGQPKLLLPLGGRSVIARLLDALQHPMIRERYVVVRPGDEPLRAAAEEAGAKAIVPATPPPDMRTSVSHAIAEIEKSQAPQDDDAWLLVPADHPVLSRGTIDKLLACWNSTSATILIPTFEGKRGHPTLFRWKLARELASIPPDRGLDWLVQRHSEEIVELPVDDPSILYDLDTPEDYQRLQRQFGSGRDEG